MRIESKSLSICGISADGQTISLGFVDTSGQEASLKIPVEQAGALAMTLPGLIEEALKRRFHDDSLRYTYPLDSWTFERSPDPSTTIVTLRTLDGFRVCFSVPRPQQIKLSEAFATQPVAAKRQVN